MQSQQLPTVILDFPINQKTQKKSRLCLIRSHSNVKRKKKNGWFHFRIQIQIIIYSFSIEDWGRVREKKTIGRERQECVENKEKCLKGKKLQTAKGSSSVYQISIFIRTLQSVYYTRIQTSFFPFLLGPA